MKTTSLIGWSLLLSTACSELPDVTSIYVNPDDSDTIFIEQTALIPLETSDSSMIYDINTLCLTDSLFIIHSRDYLRAFDRRSGKFAGNIAHKGVGDKCFSHIGNMWMNSDTINIFDPNGSCTLSFLSDGTFIAREDFTGIHSDGEKPRQLFRMEGAGIFTSNLSTDKTTDTNPRYSFYTSEHTEAVPVQGREINEPTTLADGSFVDNEHQRLLSWEPLRDTIFAVTPQGVEALYHVDFGERALPADIQAMPYLMDRAQAFNSRPNKPYASLIRYVQQYGDNIYFAFTSGDKMNSLACYNEKSGECKVIHLKSKDNRFSQTTFFKIHGDSAFVEILDRSKLFSNPYIYSIPIRILQ